MPQELRLTWHRHELALARPFVLSYGSYQRRHGIMVQVTDGEHIGLGEATAISYYGWDIDEMVELAWSLPDHFIEEELSALMAGLDKMPPLASALSCAYHDLKARQADQRLCDYMGLLTGGWPERSPITITGADAQTLEGQIAHYDWPAYKVKMGSGNDEMMADLILRHPDRLFYIDANAGWGDTDLRRLYPALSSSQVVLIEQPYPIGTWEPNRLLGAAVHKPIIADESCQSAADIPRLADFFDGVNIKLMKCGGWDGALEMRRLADVHQLRVMIGCMTETSVGISHAAHLARGAHWADLDGATLLAEDPASGASLAQGRLHLPHGAGSGATLHI